MGENGGGWVGVLSGRSKNRIGQGLNQPPFIFKISVLTTQPLPITDTELFRDSKNTLPEASPRDQYPNNVKNT